MKTLLILVLGIALGASGLGLAVRHNTDVRNVVVPVTCDCQKCTCSPCQCATCKCVEGGCKTVKPEAPAPKCCDKH